MLLGTVRLARLLAGLAILAGLSRLAWLVAQWFAYRDLRLVWQAGMVAMLAYAGLCTAAACSFLERKIVDDRDREMEE